MKLAARFCHKTPTGRKLEESTPKLAWPIPREGVRIEVARWWHESTEKRNAWWWLYEVVITLDDWDAGDARVEVILSPWRRHVDAVTGQTRGLPELVRARREIALLERSTKAKSAPEELRSAFRRMAEEVRRAAEKHRAAYERAMERF